MFLIMKILTLKILIMMYFNNHLFQWILKDIILDDENEVNEQPMSETTVNPKVLWAMKNLKTSFNPEAVKMVEFNCIKCVRGVG